MRNQFLLISFTTLICQGILSWFYTIAAYSFIITLPLVLLGIYEIFQTSRTLMRNYPLLGRMRYVMEILRPKIYQYFVESDTDGRPISRIFRSVVYQRAKEQISSTPFVALNLTSIDQDMSGLITPCTLSLLTPPREKICEY